MGFRGRGTGFSSESVDMMRQALCTKPIEIEDLFVLGHLQPLRRANRRAHVESQKRDEAPGGRLVEDLFESSGGGTRTHNDSVNSRAFCH